MRKLLTAIVAIAALFAVVAGGASAGGGNPSGSGQPNQSCQAEPTGPPGITSTTNGFATRAVNVYAGSARRTRTTRSRCPSTTWPATRSRSTTRRSHNR